MRSTQVECPKCRTGNDASAAKCSKCGIDLAWAFEHWSETVSEVIPPLILISDDEMGVLTLVGIMLNRAYYRVAKSSEPYHTLELAHRLLPDLIITDVMKPGMDGLEMTRRIKADPELEHTQVLVLSATIGRHVSLEIALGAGAAWAISKPILHHDLLAHVETVLAHSAVIQIICDSVSWDLRSSLVTHHFKVGTIDRDDPINQAKVLKPAVIALSTHLEAQSSLEVLRQLKADPLLKDIPVLMLAEEPDTEIEEQAMRLGANDIYAGPLDGGKLAQAFRSVIEKTKKA